MKETETRSVAREDIAPEHGRHLIVACDRQGCQHAVLMDPRTVFGSRQSWPVEGRSGRFRCQCGHREARLTYTRNATQANGPVSPAALSLWF